jgi:hypothetical protein
MNRRETSIAYLINNWKIVRHALPDGRVVICLYGEVFGNPRFKSGGPISTSAIERYKPESGSVLTVNGSEYQLGKPDAAEPFARQRLIRYLLENGRPPSTGDITSGGEQTNFGTKDD